MKKTQFVEVLQEGDAVNDYFVAIRKDLRTQQNGGKFLGMVFKDRTGEIGGILWNNAASVARLFELGDVVNVRGLVVSYQGRLQIRVEQVLPLKEDEYARADLVAEPEDTGEVLGKLRAGLESIQDEWLGALVKSYLDDEVFMGRFTAAAAGKKWHHAYPGGLLQHCYEVSRIAECVCEMFSSINRDLLLAAVFLHDIGKLDEMTQDLFVEYSTEGKLLGHLYMGAKDIEVRIAAIDGFPEMLRLQLMHCVLAHHGELVNGSPIVPKSIEAVVLYHCDNLDAQADAFERVSEETRKKGQPWSDYIPLIERQIWAKEE